MAEFHILHKAGFAFNGELAALISHFNDGSASPLIFRITHLWLKNIHLSRRAFRRRWNLFVRRTVEIPKIIASSKKAIALKTLERLLLPPPLTPQNCWRIAPS
jgi:hypothetical protein